MTTTCCGAPRATRYCPECGRELYQSGPLFDLLRHVEQQARIYRERAGRYTRHLEPASDHAREGRERRYACLRAAAVKWGAWAESLRGLMERGEGGPHDHRDALELLRRLSARSAEGAPGD